MRSGWVLNIASRTLIISVELPGFFMKDTTSCISSAVIPYFLTFSSF